MATAIIVDRTIVIDIRLLECLLHELIYVSEINVLFFFLMLDRILRGNISSSVSAFSVFPTLLFLVSFLTFFLRFYHFNLFINCVLANEQTDVFSLRVLVLYTVLSYF